MHEKKDFYVICDNVRSLENIGSIFRTADALKVSKIFLCGISGKPPEQKISKTALGAEEVIPWEYH
jgi:tRNA G18 (ribose-2'-O)-methylase SpoU